jgi:hypothetical protein
VPRGQQVQGLQRPKGCHSKSHSWVAQRFSAAITATLEPRPHPLGDGTPAKLRRPVSFPNAVFNYNQPMPDSIPDPTQTPPSLKTAPPPKPAPPPQPAPPPTLTEPPTNFNIGEEFGTAKRNLPPAGIVLICIAAVTVVVAIIVFQQRPKPQGSGSIDLVTAVELPSPIPSPVATTPDPTTADAKPGDAKPAPTKNILVAVTLTLRNTTDRSLWIHTLKAQLTAADGKTYEDEAASAVDLDRYFQAFPALKESSEPPLPPETKLPPGATQKGTIMFSFPVAKEAFDQRKSLEVTIQPYDQPLPIILK